MSTNSEEGSNGAGPFFVKFMIGLIIFVMLVSYILNGNYNSLDPQ